MSTIKKIIINHGKQTFTPIAYNTFEACQISVEIEVEENEDLEAVYQNAMSILSDLAEQNFEFKQKEFFQRVDSNKDALNPKKEFVEVQGFPANPIARSLSDLVTAKQLGMIRALCRENGLVDDDECQSVMQCNTDELSKAAASALIIHLQEIEAQIKQGSQLQSASF